jgi:hypothetical protein
MNPLPRHELYIVLACAQHATKTLGPTATISRIVSPKRRRPAARAISRRPRAMARRAQEAQLTPDADPSATIPIENSIKRG